MRMKVEGRTKKPSQRMVIRWNDEGGRGGGGGGEQSDGQQRFLLVDDHELRYYHSHIYRLKRITLLYLSKLPRCLPSAHLYFISTYSSILDAQLPE